MFVGPRVEYMCEALRQLAHGSRKIVAVVDLDLLPFMEDKWKGLNKNLRSLESFYKLPDTYLPPPDLKQAKGKNKKSILEQDTFLEFVEKQVIMDLLIEPFIFKYFV